MKRINNYIFAACLLCLSCNNSAVVEFETDTENISAEATGASVEVSLKSSDTWIAKTQNPWITVSPANGKGTAVCTIMIDSSLTTEPREGLVRLEMLESGERRDIKVSQKGFEYSIVAEKEEIRLNSYAMVDNREFDVKVAANLPFEIELPEGTKWLSYEMGKLELDRGARPRKVNIHFKWDINQQQDDRTIEVKFKPLDADKTLSLNKPMVIAQAAADPITPGIEGDSLSLLAISRALGCYAEFDTNERMEHWTNVKVWKSGPNKGRVRSASFLMFAIDEGLPFQVKYLDAAEELNFFSNTNTFLKNLEPGEEICSLVNLKRLTIRAYGLVSLPDSFKNLKNLEYLNLSGNNFETIPEILDRNNFPKLRSLILNANQRYAIYDISNTVKKDIGGLIGEADVDASGNYSFPVRLLKWSELDTLVLSVNYLQGTIPTLENDPSFPKWTEAEVNACDTLPARLIGLPKVLPHTTQMSINLNRLTGDIPDWLLYHPCLDLWLPDILVFPQEGKDKAGKNCGFSNTPANLDYYYKEYVNKKYNPKNQKKDEE